MTTILEMVSKQMQKRPLRIQCADDIVVVSNGCFQNEHNLPTDPISNRRMLGALFKYAGTYSVELYAYAFLPNGFWLVLSSPSADRQNFMRDFQAWLAKWMNFRLDREGRFFHERYDDETLVDAEAVIGTIVDVLVSPVREGFVRDLDAYEGATSRHRPSGEQAPVGEWIDRDRLRSLRRTTPDLSEDACIVEYPAELGDVPVGDGEGTPGSASIQALITRRVEKRVADILAWQDERGAGELLRRRNTPHPAPWDAEPTEPLGPPRYRYGYTCKAGTDIGRRRRRQMRREVRVLYSAAMSRWRETTAERKLPLRADGGEQVWHGSGGAAGGGVDAAGVAVEESVEESVNVAVDVAAEQVVNAEADAAATPVEQVVNAEADEAATPVEQPCACQLRFPTSSIPPGWTQTRRPLRRWSVDFQQEAAQNAV